MLISEYIYNINHVRISMDVILRVCVFKLCVCKCLLYAQTWAIMPLRIDVRVFICLQVYAYVVCLSCVRFRVPTSPFCSGLTLVTS